MRVFVTGHTGFKGTWLLFLLKELGADVVGYALPPEENALFSKVEGESIARSIFADICDRERLKREILSFQPDLIFHLAAKALVIPSYENPVETFETNVLGTAHLLDAVRSLPGPCSVVVVTSDKVYKGEGDFFREEDPLGGSDPYSSSKAAQELVAASFRESFFQGSSKRISTARSGNVIGGGDSSPYRLFPDLIRALEKKETLLLRHPSAVRPWQHVLEPLAGYVALAQSSKEGSYNFGPREEDHLTVEEMVKEAFAFCKAGAYAVAESPKREAKLLKLSSKKAEEDLGWKPKWSARRAIHETLLWHLEGKTSPRAYMQKQIRDYLRCS